MSRLYHQLSDLDPQGDPGQVADLFAGRAQRPVQLSVYPVDQSRLSLLSCLSLAYRVPLVRHYSSNQLRARCMTDSPADSLRVGGEFRARLLFRTHLALYPGYQLLCPPQIALQLTISGRP